MSGSTRWLVLTGIAVAVLIAVGVIASVMGGRARSYPDGSPEQAVQQYLQAVEDRDPTRARSFLSTALAARCTDLVNQLVAYRGRTSTRAVLDDATVRDGLATVRITVIESYGSAPFDSGESTMPVVFELRQESGAWRFVQSPWPLFCPPDPPRPVG